MKTIDRSLRCLAIGRPLGCANLTQFPLFGPQNQERGYVPLEEALDRGEAEITEVTGTGRVPLVCFASHCASPIFLLDGQELIGAMQDRVLNISLLAPPGRRLLIPVTCVEAARWEPGSVTFDPAPRVHFATGRAERAAQVTESLIGGGSADSDQVEAWSTIDEAARRLDAESPTRAHSALFARHARTIEQAVRVFTPIPYQTGALFAVGSSFLGLDLFDSAQTFADTLPKIVRSAAIDAIGVCGTPPAVDSALLFIDKIARASRLRFAALGIGVDVRLSGDDIAGGALTAWGRLIHLSAFPVPQR